MRISLEWLKEYLDLPESVTQLRKDLTMLGLVVDSVEEAFGQPVLEVEITANRPDCLSYIGIARDLAALYDRKLRPVPTTDKLDCDSDETPYRIQIEDPRLCPRYVGLVMSDVRVGKSPDWMQRRLEATGMRTVNNLVDITNYVLLEQGHPLHAFDYRRLRKSKIVVERARAGEKFITLDEIERELDEQMLLIKDGEGPVAIAGVMGGLNSEISDESDTVLLECAYFQPASIRRTSKRLGLSTEASYRFERGADWNGPIRAIARTCHLITEYAGGRITGGLQDAYPAPMNPVQIELRKDRAEKLLGVELTKQFIESTLAKLEFDTSIKAEGIWQVTCPSHRPDMELEADLIEELARFYGYQNIPATVPAAKSAGTAAPNFEIESRSRRLLLGLGYTEAVNLSFAHHDVRSLFTGVPGDPIEIRNPLTEDTRFLRVSLAPGLVRSAMRNINYGRRSLRLFEIGKVYRKMKDEPQEKAYLGILGTGSSAGLNWLCPDERYDYFHLKGVVDTLLQGMRSKPVEISPSPKTNWLNPADASSITVGDKTIGIMGSLHPDLEEQFKFKQPIYLAELDYEELIQVASLPVKFKSLSRFPAVERDLSIMVSRDLNYGSIRKGILSLGIAELAGLELLDIYSGKEIPPGKVSMMMRFLFQDPDRTLTVDRVQGHSDNILTFLRTNYGAELR